VATKHDGAEWKSDPSDNECTRDAFFGAEDTFGDDDIVDEDTSNMVEACLVELEQAEAIGEGVDVDWWSTQGVWITWNIDGEVRKLARATSLQMCVSTRSGEGMVM
jgi:hypothetical protein